MKTSQCSFRFVLASLGVAAPLAMFSPGLINLSKASTVLVTPANMNGWTLNTFDNTGTIANTGGTAAMVTGPDTPPLGVGSAHLATPVNGGDGAAAIATEQFDGTPLASITSLTYSSYLLTNAGNNQQFPYLAVSINTNDGSGDTDTLFLEPPYQQHSSGNPLLTDQGAPVLGQWQTWTANTTTTGGFWDNNGIANPGSGVQPLSVFEAAYPAATIANGGFTGLGGIAMQVGFASAGNTFDGNVDAFTIGIGTATTTFNFEPNAVPEPGTLSLLGMGAAALLMVLRRRWARR